MTSKIVLDGHSTVAAIHPILSLKIRAITHPGSVRADNEDHIAVGPWFACGTMQSAHAQDWQTKTRTVCIVADGMSAHKAGALASRLVTEFVVDRVSDITSTTLIRDILNDANQYLHAVMMPETQGMGSTAAGLIIRGDEAIYFNVGDSRIYQVTNNDVVMLSTDDTRNSHFGFKTSSTLTQVLGGSNPNRKMEPHVGTLRLQPGEKYLICSDGVSDLIDENEIYDILGLSGKRDVDRLLATVLERGGRDNASAIVIEVAC